MNGHAEPAVAPLVETLAQRLNFLRRSTATLLTQLTDDLEAVTSAVKAEHDRVCDQITASPNWTTPTAKAAFKLVIYANGCRLWENYLGTWRPVAVFADAVDAVTCAAERLIEASAVLPDLKRLYSFSLTVETKTDDVLHPPPNGYHRVLRLNGAGHYVHRPGSTATLEALKGGPA